ncbi:hypothetical protein BS78_01G001900 [Paspalum vaginatum]|nr:hypothetical protein BS78_01G001900 [Paspalum vaginatum]
MRRHLLFHLQAAATTPSELIITYRTDYASVPAISPRLAHMRLIDQSSSASLHAYAASPAASVIHLLAGFADLDRLTRVWLPGLLTAPLVRDSMKPSERRC